jgi:hypothetical protein
MPESTGVTAAPARGGSGVAAAAVAVAVGAGAVVVATGGGVVGTGGGQSCPGGHALGSTGATGSGVDEQAEVPRQARESERTAKRRERIGTGSFQG